MFGTRSGALRTQHALSEDEMRAYIERCPKKQRWAFEGWLRGERELDGDLIEPESGPDEPWTSAP